MMKKVLIACVLVAFVTASYVEMFEQFKKDYNRQYPGAAAEAQRFSYFVENMKKAEKLNRLNPLASFGVNEFSDISAAEFKVRHSAEKHYKSRAAVSVPDMYTAEQVKAAAKSVDWRKKGAVTYVKNQGQCGSCWSFSSTGSIEGQWFLAGHTLVAVSEQELVSCDTTDSGCNGGLMDNAWTWLVKHNKGAIAAETKYPYVSGNGQVPACKKQLESDAAAKITGHENLPKNEDQMATWMETHGPISIAVDATSWQTYKSGIMTKCVSSQVDHGVLAVGYDDESKPPYWIIKNSWGASWGEAGYIRVEKGKDECLITYMPCSSKV